jgi:peptide/nickel transport system substrate-binding protein
VLTVAGLVAACGGSTTNNTGSNSAATATGAARSAGTSAPAASPSGITGGLVTPAARATTAGSQPKRGGTITIGFTTNPATQDPHTDPQGVHYWWYPLFDQLIAYNKKGELDPAQSLAQKWEQTDPTTLKLSLRQGITFHDGTPFGAEDVKWNIARIQDPATHAVPRPDLASIDSVEAPDKNTIVLHLKQPNAALLAAFGDRGGMMISPTAFTKLGKDGFAKAPVGTGAFSFKSWNVDADATYERNPNYWRKDVDGGVLPYLQTLKFAIIPDPTVLVAALESGQIDVIPFTPAVDQKRLSADKKYIVSKFVGDKTSIYYMDHAFPPLDNLMFRRAVSAGLDRQSYIKNFLSGDEPSANGLLTPASWAYAPDIQNYNFDAAKAKEFLQQSGMPSSAWRFKAAAGTKVADSDLLFETSLKSVGITVDWVIGTNQFAANLMKGFGGDGTVGMLLSSWGMRVDPDGSVAQFYTQQGTYNAGLAAVPDTEDLVVKARQSYDTAERKKLYHEIQQKGVENVYSAFLLDYTIVNTHAAAKVGNMENLYGGEGKMRFANLWV